jgi:molybdenum cofactor synthesis domain-containing protein
MEPIPIGVVTVSDRASRGLYEDKGGPGIEAALAAILATPWRPMRRLVPDERPAIEAALVELADAARCSLILTTGGTGPARRDVTPEATEAVCERLLPGFGEPARSTDRDSFASTRRHARRLLDRQSAGQTLIHPHLPRCGLPGDPLLPRPHRRSAAGDEPRSLPGVPAQGVTVAMRTEANGVPRLRTLAIGRRPRSSRAGRR